MGQSADVEVLVGLEAAAAVIAPGGHQDAGLGARNRFLANELIWRRELIILSLALDLELRT